MNRRLSAALLAGLFLCLVLVFPVYNALGFGDFDSGSDFGGFDSDYSSGGYDYDYDSGDYSSSRSSGSGKSNPSAAGIIIMLALIGFVAVLRSSGTRSSSRGSGSSPQRYAPGRQTRTKISEIGMDEAAYKALRERDPGYSEIELFDYIKTLFAEMQTGWESGDISNVQYGFLPDTWQRFATQLKMKNQRGETTHVRDIVFRELRVIGFRALENENRDKLQVRFKVEYNVWVTNGDGKNIQGNPDTRHLMTYLWAMERPHSVLTQRNAADASHCPNCGAELDVSAFAECPFCHTQLRQNTANWVIRDIQAESQVTIR